MGPWELCDLWQAAQSLTGRGQSSLHLCSCVLSTNGDDAHGRRWRHKAPCCDCCTLASLEDAEVVDGLHVGARALFCARRHSGWCPSGGLAGEICLGDVRGPAGGLEVGAQGQAAPWVWSPAEVSGLTPFSFPSLKRAPMDASCSPCLPSCPGLRSCEYLPPQLPG